MKILPEKQQQIITMHADFICQVVRSSQAGDRQTFEQLLTQAEKSGWGDLSRAARQIADGQRDLSLLGRLDEEDLVIAEAIMRGMQNPATLPNPEQKADPAVAAQGLAGMIKEASNGSPQALALISEMAVQMSNAGGPMATLASVIRPLINGERDADKLCKGVDKRTEGLILDILSELGNDALH